MVVFILVSREALSRKRDRNARAAQLRGVIGNLAARPPNEAFRYEETQA